MRSYLLDDIDKCNLCYVRINTAILSLHSSVDLLLFQVPGTLAYLGISNDLQNGAGAMGAASLTCVALTPLHLGVMPYLVPGILSYKERLQENVDTAKDVIDKMNRK
jgi:hypothetical protein